MKKQITKGPKSIIIIDTSAFLAGFDPFSFNQDMLTVPKVQAEIQRNSTIKTRIETAIESGKLKVKLPKEAFSIMIKNIANQAGDAYKLSEADSQLLALAMEEKAEGYLPQIITDDYSIQNVAKQAQIEFVAIATFGIKRVLDWIRYCPACHKKYPNNTKTKECLVCGTELKRKPYRQKVSSST